MSEQSKHIQAILFSANEPVKLSSLVSSLELAEADIVSALEELKNELEASGLRLSEHMQTYRLVSAPESAPILAKFHDQSLRTELSKPALETLAIIAYQGPLTRHAIEEIRGVGSEQMLKNLSSRGLIEEAGRANEPGKPSLYAVTHLFLETVGVTDLSELPPLPEDEAK